MIRARHLTSLLLSLAACSGGNKGDGGTTGPSTANLQVTIETPSGVVGVVHVTGPKGFSRDLTASTSLTDLVLGDYVIAADTAMLSGDMYGPTPDTTRLGLRTAGSYVAQDTVKYAIRTGRLTFQTTGLPSGLKASYTVNYGSTTYSDGDTLKGLPWRDYVVVAATVFQGTTTYGGLHNNGTMTATFNVKPSTIASVDTVTYSAMTGTIRLQFDAPPSGTSSIVTVTGPFGFSRSYVPPVNDSLVGLPLGIYGTTAPDAQTATEIYGANLPAAVLNAESRSTRFYLYWQLVTGSLHVDISGLPTGVPDSVVFVEPNGTPHPVTASGTFYKLPPGLYSIVATPVMGAGVPYVPTLPVQSVTVPLSLTPTVASVGYAPFDLTIDGLYIIQSTQTYTGSVPLIANRDGFLRVFVRSPVVNSAAPKVRVRWYSNGGLVRTDILTSPGDTTPTVIAEMHFGTSWNLPVPASLIQPNLSILADVDPDNTIAEVNESNNSFPATGTPLALDVRTPSIFQVSAVPIKLRFDKTSPTLDAGNVGTFFSLLQKMHPVPGYQAVVHATYTTADSLPLLPYDDNGEWFNILNEMSALQVAEAASDSLYYYAVVHPNYTGGVAGLGWIGAPAAVGWDRGINAQIAAHEIGHNWGLYHAPCGNPSGVDPNWPTDPRYVGGYIGVLGMDVATGAIKTPTSYFDIMSYCQSLQWISDYNYVNVMNFRAAHPAIVSAMAMAPEPVLLVWGQMRGGKLVLEPAFEIQARRSLPSASGPYTIEGLDAGGGALFSYSFAGREAADAPRGGRGFAFAIPLAGLNVSRLAALRLAGPGGAVRREGAAALAAMRTGAMPAPALSVRAIGGGRTRVRWDGTTYPMALIRDAATGEVLSFARGGSVEVPASGPLEIILSDGVRTVRVAP